MRKLLKTKWVHALVIAWIFSFAMIICANVCQISSINAAEHSCCPENNSQSETHQNSTEVLCQNTQFLLSKTFVSDESNRLLMSDIAGIADFFVQILLIDLSNTAPSFKFVEAVPQMAAKQPLYLSRQAFLL